jgi:hypothetical protein
LVLERRAELRIFFAETAYIITFELWFGASIEQERRRAD